MVLFLKRVTDIISFSILLSATISAGSILAKVAREENVGDLRNKVGIDFGSGYPADPKTKEFLIKHGRKFADEKIIRQSWSTWKNIVKKNDQKKLL